MKVVHIDLPIFIDGTTALGWFAGDIEVTEDPSEGQLFPWPASWLTKHRDLLETQAMQVWSTSSWAWPPAKIHITMFGINCESAATARDLVEHIQTASGILFSEHEHGLSG